jgi:hypothetical protein
MQADVTNARMPLLHPASYAPASSVDTSHTVHMSVPTLAHTGYAASLKHDAWGILSSGTNQHATGMKRFETLTTLLRQADRVADPLTGRVLDSVPNFDPALLPHLDWPVSPALQRAVAQTVTEAIALQLSFSEATAGVTRVLSSFGIQLARGRSWQPCAATPSAPSEPPTGEPSTR